MLSTAEINNVWQHWFAGHLAAVGAKVLMPLEPLSPAALAAVNGRHVSAPEMATKPSPSPHAAAPPNRKARRGAAKETRRMLSNRPRLDPQAEWAKQLHESRLNRDLTFGGMLEGIDVYYRLFRKLARVDPWAYEYFSRVGAPIVVNGIAAWSDVIEKKVIIDAEKLPAFFGAFFVRSDAEYRVDIIDDRPSFMDFHYFSKVSGKHTVGVPPGVVVYTAHLVSLGRSVFTKRELKKYKWTERPFGLGWRLGVFPDGQVRALPMQMTTHQPLPRGGSVKHSGMMIPPGLYYFSRDESPTDPHQVCLNQFSVVRAFTAAALSGVQITFRRKALCVRIGLPIDRLKEFFRDRDVADGERRRPILHYISQFTYVRDGRDVVVGEHLRGARQFDWRGYEVNISVPGIHHPSAEGLSTASIEEDEQLDPKVEYVDLREVANVMQAETFKGRVVPMRRGEPTARYLSNPL